MTNNLERFTSGSLVVDGKDLYLGLSILSFVCTNTPRKMLGPILSLYRFILHMHLNETIVDHKVWDEKAITDRAEALSKEALQVWPYPSLDDSVVDKYRPKKLRALEEKRF